MGNHFSSVQSLSRVPLFVTPWIAARQASLSITNSWSSLRLMSIESVMPSSHLILCRPFSSCPQSLPASESFPMSQLFTWGGQSTGVSALALFLPKKSQGWSPSEWTGWITLQSKGLSRVFSNTTVQKHQFFLMFSKFEWLFYLLSAIGLPNLKKIKDSFQDKPCVKWVWVKQKKCYLIKSHCPK